MTESALWHQWLGDHDESAFAALVTPVLRSMTSRGVVRRSFARSLARAGSFSYQKRSPARSRSK